TIWERWDGIKPDSAFQTPSMNSFNHYSYGAIGDWMYRVIAGIDTYEDEPGYKHIRIMPHIGGGLSYANADLQTYYGTVSSHWKLENDKLLLDVEIPANTKANIFIPATTIESIKESGKKLDDSKGLQVKGIERNYVIVETGSGIFHFSVDR
ncbi:MAG: alpha-L-rhamnosidase C-terminal domain-containing protein, partial [Bacteroidota bacterium]